MPRGDGTGPMGYGSMTGRGAGCCAGYTMPGFANRRFGFGSDRGLGTRRIFWKGSGYILPMFGRRRRSRFL